jgi:hypothetical protein
VWHPHQRSVPSHELGIPYALHAANRSNHGPRAGWGAPGRRGRLRWSSELTQSLSQRPYFACLMPQPLARGDRLCGVVAVVRSLGSTQTRANFGGDGVSGQNRAGAPYWQYVTVWRMRFPLRRGFIRVSPYWQYVTVWRMRFPVRREERRRCFYLAICSPARNLWR